MAWCLTKQAEAKLLEALEKDGNPQKMVDRGTEGRLAWFAQYVGEENATHLNYVFETKMLLKSQQKGMQSFVNSIGGSKQIQTDFLSKVNRLKTALSNKELDQYLETFVSQRLGTSINEEEFKTISKLSDDLNKLKESFDSDNKIWKSEKDGIDFGAKQQALNVFIENLKSGDKPVKEMLKDRGYRFKEELETKGKIRATANILLDTAKTIAENSVALVASFDDSFIGRQGIVTLLTGHPKVWGKAGIKSIGDFANTLRGKNAEDALMATVFSDPLYITGEYEKAKIIDRMEEQYPTSLAQKIPVVGRFLKASDVAFKNSGVRIRTETYKILRDVKESRGIEMTPEQVVGLGKVINSMSARGSLGRFDNPLIRLAMWAPKMLKADLDILTAHTFSDIPKADKKVALDNLVKIILATVIIESIATLNDKESTEFNPLSSDFLKLKFGDTRINFLRGMQGIIVLVARMLMNKYKSATTGEIKDYGSGFGETSRFDALLNFFVNKAPPATRGVIDVLRGRNFAGDEPTLSSTLIQTGVPITIQNVIQLVKNPTIDKAFGVVLDFFGIGSNTFRDSNIKSEIIPTNEVIKNEDFMSMVQVYAKALGTDPETAFNRIFSGQKIMQVSDGGIIVVARQDVADSEAFKKQWVKDNGGSVKDMKEVKLDHTIPNKLGGSESPDNWKVVPTAVWSSYTKVENALIKAVKDKKVSLKEAQQMIVEFKKIDDTKDRATRGQEIIDQFKNTSFNPFKVKEAMASDVKNKVPTPPAKLTQVLRDMALGKDFVKGMMPTREQLDKYYELEKQALAGKLQYRSSAIANVEKDKKATLDIINRNADKYGVPRDLATDIAYAESVLDHTNSAEKGGFDGKTKNSKGEILPYSSAEGLYMFTDDTWSDLKRWKVIPQDAKKTNAEYNVRGAMYMISKGYLSRWDASKDEGKAWGQYYSEEELSKFYGK